VDLERLETARARIAHSMEEALAVQSEIGFPTVIRPSFTLGGSDFSMIDRAIATARAHGLRTADGLGMLLHQAVRGFERWFGVKPEVTPELRTLVEADLLKKK